MTEAQLGAAMYWVALRKVFTMSAFQYHYKYVMKRIPTYIGLFQELT